MIQKFFKAALAIVVAFSLSFSFALAHENGVAENSNGGNVTQTDDDQSFNDAKEKWQKAQEELKGKKGKIEDQLKKDALEKAKKHAIATVERAIKKLKKIQERINKMKVISAERKNSLLADINTQILALENIQDQLKTATTKDELKTAMEAAKAQIVKVKELVKKIVAEILASHLDKVLEKLNKIAGKLEKKINELKTKGVDVTDLEKLLTQGQDKITEAKNKLQSGQYKEARKAAEEARAALAKLAGQIKAAQAKLEGDNSQGGEND